MNTPSQDATQLPTAEASPRQSKLWFVWMPLLALAIAVYMVYSSVEEKGLLIAVHTNEGHGIREGASVRYRGIQVGIVETLQLTEELSGVDLLVRLDEDARNLAREGTQFWIVYPRVGLDGIQGIETVIGARYLAVSPQLGSESPEPSQAFNALPEPPVEYALVEGGLQIVLDAPSKFGLEPGAPVTYRGFWIGRVVSVNLASDATVVEVTVRIASEYRSLVRTNSVFWEESGIEMDLSLTGGVTLDVGTLRSLLMGAVAMATPSYPGETVESGRRFPLVAGPEKDWLQWRPALPIGNGAIPGGLVPPSPLKSRVVWRSGKIIRQRNSHHAWLLPIDGRLLGPADFFDVPESALEKGGLEFRVGGQDISEFPTAEVQGELATCPQVVPAEFNWPSDRMRKISGPEDCMVYAGPTLAPQSIAAYRLEESPRGLEVSNDMRFSSDWHGAPVVGRGDGSLIGLLLLVDGRAHIAPVVKGN